MVVDYDSISLSDTGSLVSLEEYKNRNGSGYSLSYTSEKSQELEDDDTNLDPDDVSNEMLRRSLGAEVHPVDSLVPGA